MKVIFKILKALKRALMGGGIQSLANHERNSRIENDDCKTAY